MADVTPDYEIERLKIEVQISQLSHNKLASTLRRKQAEADLRRIEEQISATDAAIAEQREILASIPKA